MDITKPAQLDLFVSNYQLAKAFYDAMMSAHWLLTGQDDHINVAMFGLSAVDLQTGLDQMEALFQALKVEFFYKNSIQALSIILMIGDQHQDSVQRISTLKQAFRDRQLKMDQQYTLTTMGVLALLPYNSQDLVDAVQATYDKLYAQSGFGF